MRSQVQKHDFRECLGRTATKAPVPVMMRPSAVYLQRCASGVSFIPISDCQCADALIWRTPVVQHWPNQNAAQRREDDRAADIERAVLEEELPTQHTRVSVKAATQRSAASSAAASNPYGARASSARAWQMTSPSRLRPPAVTDFTATGLLKAHALSQKTVGWARLARLAPRAASRATRRACLVPPCTPPRSRRRCCRRRCRRRLHRHLPHAEGGCRRHRRRRVSGAPSPSTRDGTGAAHKEARRAGARERRVRRQRAASTLASFRWGRRPGVAPANWARGRQGAPTTHRRSARCPARGRPTARRRAGQQAAPRSGLATRAAPARWRAARAKTSVPPWRRMGGDVSSVFGAESCGVRRAGCGAFRRWLISSASVTALAEF